MPANTGARPVVSSPEAGSVLDVSVKKRYHAKGTPDFVLEASFQVMPGFTILAGPSGAGKSTMLRCIAGLTHPDEGRIVLGSRVLFDSQQGIKVDAAERNVAFVFQRLALFPHLTVEENVGYGLRRVLAAEREQRITGILEAFHVSHLRKVLPRKASGGEQQRIALARSLVTEPSLLLLDEPLSSLDVRTKSEIIDDLKKWNARHSVPILYVTHNYEEMFALGEQVIVFDSAGMMKDGLPVDVVSEPDTGARPRQKMENLVPATVLRPQPEKGTMICRLGNTVNEIQVPLAYAPPGSEVLLSIPRDEVVLAGSRPELLGEWNALRGTIQSAEWSGRNLAVRVYCGVELNIELSQGSLTELQRFSDVWLMIRPESCHFVRIQKLRPLQRLLLFVCNRNTTRSPLAEAICNAEIARRLRIPLGALAAFEVRAVSAGLSANPGEPMSDGARQALEALGIPARQHASQRLSPELVELAERIFCMSSEQCNELVSQFPGAASKISCLDEQQDVPEPTYGSEGAFQEFSAHLQQLIRLRLNQVLPAEN